MSSTITVQVSDELAERLQEAQAPLPQVLELGLREWTASAQIGFQGASDVLEFLAGLPSPEELLLFRPSEGFQRRVQDLLETGRSRQFNMDERREWEGYQYLEHLVRLAKAAALEKIKSYPDHA